MQGKYPDMDVECVHIHNVPTSDFRAYESNEEAANSDEILRRTDSFFRRPIVLKAPLHQILPKSCVVAIYGFRQKVFCLAFSLLKLN